MRAVLLAFVVFAIAIQTALAEAPRYELFLIKPDQIVKTTVITHGDWDTLEITVTEPAAKALLAFSQRNLGKYACVALLPPNKYLVGNSIVLSPAPMKALITNGVVHLTQPSRKARMRGLLAD